MKKILFILLTIFILFGCDINQNQDLSNSVILFNPKIAFSFDDQNIENWFQSLIYLKNKYPDFTTTLFVSNIYDISDDGITKYKELYNLGFEIGTHNTNHENSIEFIENHGEQEFINMQIEQIDFWKSHGIVISSFAYPYGAYDNATDDALKNIYSTIRYTGGDYIPYPCKQFIGSFPTDKKESIFMGIFNDNSNTNNIISAYGHKLLENDTDNSTSLLAFESWIVFCIDNNYEFINMKDISKKAP